MNKIKGFVQLPNPHRWEVLGHLYHSLDGAKQAAWLLSPTANESLPIHALYSEDEVKEYSAKMVAASNLENGSHK